MGLILSGLISFQFRMEKLSLGVMSLMRLKFVLWFLAWIIPAGVFPPFKRDKCMPFLVIGMNEMLS